VIVVVFIIVGFLFVIVRAVAGTVSVRGWILGRIVHIAIFLRLFNASVVVGEQVDALFGVCRFLAIMRWWRRLP
jgi:hypothetical protein